MASVFVLLKSRILPALLTALGVVLVTAGLLSYVDPTTAGTAVIETPEIVEAPRSRRPRRRPPRPSRPAPRRPSSRRPTPKPTKTPTGREVATRVVVPALNIDLPVIRGTDAYPYCNVAMYLSSSKKAAMTRSGSRARGASRTSTPTHVTGCSARSTTSRSRRRRPRR